MERAEPVTIKYDSSENKITIKGSTFELVLDVSSDALSGVYWGAEGYGQAKLTVDKN